MSTSLPALIAAIWYLAAAVAGAGVSPATRPTKVADTPIATEDQKSAVSRALAAARGHADASRWSDVIAILAPLTDQLDPQGLVLLAGAYDQSRQTATADEVLAAAVARYPNAQAAWLAYIDIALARQRYAAALRRIESASARIGDSAELRYRAARAYFGLGRLLGDSEVRAVRNGRPGACADGWLVVEPRDERRDEFLCCPEQSALYQVHLALESDPGHVAGRVLHARIWARLGCVDLAYAALQSHERLLLKSDDPSALVALSDLARAAGDMPAYLRYEQLRAKRDVAHADDILHRAFLTAADHFATAGDEATYRAFLRRALARHGDDRTSMLRLADAEWSAENHAAAAALYRRLLADEPAHRERARMLERIAKVAAEQPPPGAVGP